MDGKCKEKAKLTSRWGRGGWGEGDGVRVRSQCNLLGFFCSYTMPHELCNQNVFTAGLVPQYGGNNYCVLCTVKAKKASKNLKQRNLSGLITILVY